MAGHVSHCSLLPFGCRGFPPATHWPTVTCNPARRTVNPTELRKPSICLEKYFIHLWDRWTDSAGLTIAMFDPYGPQRNLVTWKPLRWETGGWGHPQDSPYCSRPSYTLTPSPSCNGALAACPSLRAPRSGPTAPAAGRCPRGAHQVAPQRRGREAQPGP